MTEGYRTTDLRTNTPENGYNLSGALTWNPGENVFRGTVSNATHSGNAAGRFYGPTANELGGVLHARTPDGQSAVQGSFGAAKQP